MQTISKNTISLIIIVLGIITIGVFLYPGQEIINPPVTELIRSADSESDHVANTELNLDQTAASINSLKNILLEEMAARKRLERRLNVIEQHLGKSSNTPIENQNQLESSVSSESFEQSADAEGWINEEFLLSQGLEQTQIDQLRDNIEQNEMDKLYLRDRAMREGWINSKRFDEELGKINNRLENVRSEIGEDGYDALLYSMGRINRVKIRNVFQNSPAQVAGIMKDDIIVSYANKRIFNWQDLRTASTQGQVGENTNIVINRDGQQMQLLIPRGPLGVQLYEYSEPPS